MSQWRTTSVGQTEELGRRLAAELGASGVLLLTGDLGAGKTVLARGVAAGLGIDRREIQSPTFTIMREHRAGDRHLVHLDLYRLEPSEVAALGIEETLRGPGIKVVEWAERLGFPVAGARTITIRLGRDTDERIIEESES